jgi:hypothetical protein
MPFLSVLLIKFLVARHSLSVPELVDVLLTGREKGPEPLPLRFGASFKAYALRGIFAFPR